MAAIMLTKGFLQRAFLPKAGGSYKDSDSWGVYTGLRGMVVAL